MKIAFVIPARFKSKRFPGKPLKNIMGVPMIIRTVNQCLKVISKKDIYVATDDSRISNICKKNNINSIIIKKKCLTGTDRVARFSNIKKEYTNFINIQGDEPIFNPKDLKKMISYTKRNPNQIYGGYCKINDQRDFFNPSIPKVVLNKKNDLLYMSRAGIPSNKKKRFIKALRQVCIYSFPKNSLNKFLLFKKKTLLENIEDLELLRFIENDISVKMISMSNMSISVDLPIDLKKVEKRIRLKIR